MIHMMILIIITDARRRLPTPFALLRADDIVYYFTRRYAC